MTKLSKVIFTIFTIGVASATDIKLEVYQDSEDPLELTQTIVNGQATFETVPIEITNHAGAAYGGDDLDLIAIGFTPDYMKCDIEVTRGPKTYYKKGLTGCTSSYASYASNTIFSTF